MITTTRTDLADKMSRIVDHGRNDNLESIEMGTNLRMSEVSAAIGRIQLKHLEEWTTKRGKNANSIKHQTKIRTDSEHAWHQLCILSDNPKELISNLTKQESMPESTIQFHATGIGYILITFNTISLYATVEDCTSACSNTSPSINLPGRHSANQFCFESLIIRDSDELNQPERYVF